MGCTVSSSKLRGSSRQNLRTIVAAAAPVLSSYTSPYCSTETSKLHGRGERKTLIGALPQTSHTLDNSIADLFFLFFFGGAYL